MYGQEQRVHRAYKVCNQLPQTLDCDGTQLASFQSDTITLCEPSARSNGGLQQNMSTVGSDSKRGLTFFKKAILFIIALIILGFAAFNALPLIVVSLPTNSWQLVKSDVIIVLGTPATRDGQPSPTMRERVLKGVELFKKGFAPNLIFTGAAAHNPHIEAEVMSQLAQSEGVPAGHIITENFAQNTYQNAFNSVKIMREHNWNSAVIISSPAHVRRANFIFSHYPIKYCVVECKSPAEVSQWMLFLQDQRDKGTLLATVFSGRAKTIGLTAEQIKELAH